MRTLRLHVLALGVAFLASSGVAHAGSVKLAWDASQDPAVFGYRLYWGTQSGQYTSSLDVRTATSVTVPNLTDGTAYYFIVRAYNSLNTESAPSIEVSRRIGIAQAVAGDFTGDFLSDVGLFRPSTGNWFVAGMTSAPVWGGAGDVPVAGDYDGDAKMDIGVFRRTTGKWYLVQSRTGTALEYTWGGGTDRPVQGDYDGDGRTDVAVFRAATGKWYVIQSSTGTMREYTWGGEIDIPVPGDYDGDGRTDVAVFRPSNGTWYLRHSSTGALTTVVWGGATDIPVLRR